MAVKGTPLNDVEGVTLPDSLRNERAHKKAISIAKYLTPALPR